MNIRYVLLVPALFVSGLAFAADPAPAPAPAKPTFASLDVNKDGKIDKAEAAKSSALAAKFDALDTDKSGGLSTTEFAAWK